MRTTPSLNPGDASAAGGTRCPRSCAEVCIALETALRTEKQAILGYAELRDQCSFPEIRTMLNELVLRQEKTIRYIEEVKLAVAERFDVLEQIRAGFDMA
jgi:hypothetical protein